MTTLRLGDPGTEWVSGHAGGCVPMPGVSTTQVPVPCHCGFSSLKVHAWPAPAGEGVLCKAEGGDLFVSREVRKPVYLASASRAAPFMLLGLRPEDAPIRDAWERLCREHQAAKYNPLVKPPDGLYLFHDDDLLPVEDMTEEWEYRLSKRDGVGRPVWTVENLTKHIQILRPNAKSLRFTAQSRECWFSC